MSKYDFSEIEIEVDFGKKIHLEFQIQVQNVKICHFNAKKPVFLHVC